jgi:hypothetical protein
MSEQTRRCEWCGEIAQGKCGCAAETEIARLREDAERYRWLRDDKRGRMLSVSSLNWTGNPELSDAAIDAARKETK